MCLGEVVSGQQGGSGFKRPLDQAAGTLLVHCEEIIDSAEFVSFTLHGKDLDKKDFFGKSDPYFGECFL